jgi:hypothetical protein
MTMQRISRRRLSGLSGLSLLGASLSGWLPRLAAQVQQSGQRSGRSCILLWMPGGPSQMETFDPHPGHENGGPTKSIETSVPGIRIAEHLPKLAGQMQDLALIRSMTTKEGDHSRATYYLRTGYLPQGPLTYPALGSLVGRALQREEADLPACISINPFRALSPSAFTAGFLGPAWSPLSGAESETCGASEWWRGGRASASSGGAGAVISGGPSGCSGAQSCAVI